jgi:hypothetical protein
MNSRPNTIRLTESTWSMWHVLEKANAYRVWMGKPEDEIILRDLNMYG